MPRMAALKKTDEAKYKAICHGHPRGRRLHRSRRERQSDRPEARRQPGHLGLLRLQLPRRKSGKLKGIAINGVAPTYEIDQQLQISGRAAALHLRQERARQGDPGGPRLVAEFTKESAFGPSGYLRRAGMIAAPNGDSRAQPQAARGLRAAEPRGTQVASTTIDSTPRPSNGGRGAHHRNRGKGLIE